LEEYVKSDDVGDDSASVEIVVEYLKVLNSLFELSLLGKYVRVFKTNGSTLQRMKDGFRFIKTWCEDAMENGLCNCLCMYLYCLVYVLDVVLCT